MATLTYRPGVDWEPRHIAHYCRRVRKWLKRRKFSFVYCWVCELQLRGAPHYHILVKLPNKKTKLPKPDASGMWPHGCSEIAWVYKSARNYMAKYCSKVSQRFGCSFARGMRLHGCGGLPPDARAWFRWLLAPLYVRRESDPSDLVQRCPGGYRLRCGSGYRFLPTPFVGVCVPGYGVRLTLKSSDAWAYSSFDPFPASTDMNRHNAWNLVGNYADVMSLHAGITINNPFHHAKNGR